VPSGRWRACGSNTAAGAGGNWKALRSSA